MNIIKRFLKSDIWDKITVEPLLFIYYMSVGLERPTVNGLWYWKICMILNNNEWICENLNQNETLEELENEVQVMNSKWNFYDDLCQKVPSMLLIFFVYGSVSDRISRKLPIALPIIGNTINLAIKMMSSVYIQSSLGYMLLGSLFSGFTGSISAVFMGVMSYVSDVSSAKTRALRISVAYGCMNIGEFISSTVSGLLYESTGFIFVFSTCILLNMISILYLWFGFPDIKNDKKLQQLDVTEKNSLGENQKIKQKPFFNKERFKVPFEVTFKKRKNNNRVHIIVILLVFALDNINKLDRDISFLFLKSPPISFTQTQYGFYTGYDNLIKIVTMLLIIPVLKKKFGFWDSVLFSAAMFSIVFDMVIMGISVTKWMVCIAPIVGFLGNGLNTFGRSMLSTMVEVTEIGTIFSVMSLIANIMGIFRSAFYSFFLYPATVEFFPGFSYLFAALALLIPAGLTIWIHLDIKKHSKSNDNTECFTLDVSSEKLETKKKEAEDNDNVVINTEDISQRL